MEQEYKRPIPPFASTVGIVTAPTGVGNPGISFILRPGGILMCSCICAPALVQGEDAAESIADGIRRLDAFGVDVIIVGRGGV